MSNIPQPQRDEQGKIVGDFYPLQRAELIALRKNKLINNAAYVHLALRYENPFLDRPIELYPKEFAMRWQMPESSVYEAIAKLKQTNVVNIKSGKVVLEWTHSQEDIIIDSQEHKVSGNPESLRKSRKNSGFSETVLDCQKKFWDPRIDSEIPENEPPEPLPQADSKTPQTIQTYSNSTTTTNTDNVAADAEKEIVPEPNSQNKQPTEEEIKAALQKIADLSSKIKISGTVKKYLIKFWANFSLALAGTEEAIGSGSLKNPTGFFINALKNPVEVPKTVSTDAGNSKKEWKYEDDWTQHPQYERWLHDAYRRRWDWVKEPASRAGRMERGYFLDWCEENKAFAIFEESRT